MFWWIFPPLFSPMGATCLSRVLLFDQYASLLSHSVCLLTSAAPDSAASGGSTLLNLDFFGPVEDSTNSASMPGQHLLLLILPFLHLTCNLHQISTHFHFCFSLFPLLQMQLLSAPTCLWHFVPMGAVEFVLFKLFERKLEHV